jgi:hypothetical protein
VLKQVGIGYLAFIVAGDHGDKAADLYRLTLHDRTLEADSQVEPGAYDVVHRIDEAWQLSQRGHQSAFDLFLRWAPRAQPVLEDTRPTFDVTRPAGSSPTVNSLPERRVPSGPIPLVPPPKF